MDDYFYPLRTVAEETGVSLRMTCLLLTGQLQPAVQSHMKEWVNWREEVTRGYRKRVHRFGTEGIDREGINLDLGYSQHKSSYGDRTHSR